MYTIDDIKLILDEDASTPDGYNLIRANLMTRLSSDRTEYDNLVAERDRIQSENERLKQANATLYSRIEKQITDEKKEEEKQKEEEKKEEEKKPEEIIKETVDTYKGLI